MPFFYSAKSCFVVWSQRGPEGQKLYEGPLTSSILWKSPSWWLSSDRHDDHDVDPEPEGWFRRGCPIIHTITGKLWQDSWVNKSKNISHHDVDPETGWWFRRGCRQHWTLTDLLCHSSYSSPIFQSFVNVWPKKVHLANFPLVWPTLTHPANFLLNQICWHIFKTRAWTNTPIIAIILWNTKLLDLGVIIFTKLLLWVERSVGSSPSFKNVLKDFFKYLKCRTPASAQSWKIRPDLLECSPELLKKKRNKRWKFIKMRQGRPEKNERLKESDFEQLSEYSNKNSGRLLSLSL